MEELLGPLGLKPFQDDIAIASISSEQHKKDVLEVLELLTYKAGLKLRLKKCRFFVKEARVLGSIIDSEGIRMDPVKIKAIVNGHNQLMGKLYRGFWELQTFIEILVMSMPN